MQSVGLGLAAALSLLSIMRVGSTARAAPTLTATPILKCVGVSVPVPAVWYGRVRGGHEGFFTLTLATFPLVPERDDVDERSATRMRSQDVLLLLIGYGPDQATNPAFKAHPELPLTVQQMNIYRQFEHLPSGHRLARAMFTVQGGAYDVQVQFARPITASLSDKANSVLRLFRFHRHPTQTPNASSTC
jgi:hypothetical protein